MANQIEPKRAEMEGARQGVADGFVIDYYHCRNSYVYSRLNIANCTVKIVKKKIVCHSLLDQKINNIECT